jgi:hypothetical protein
MPQHIDQLRAARRETQEGNRTIIQENAASSSVRAATT